VNIPLFREKTLNPLLFLALTLSAHVSPAETIDTPACQPDITDLTPLSNTKQKTTISADNSSLKNGLFSLQGHVLIQYADQNLKADQVRYNSLTGDIDLTGNISLSQPAIIVKASRGHANTLRQTAELNQIEFQLKNLPGRGSANLVTLPNKHSAILHQITYTTCSKQKKDWVLKADQIKLNHTDEVGEARQATLWFKGIPLLYLPRMSFPIGDKRKTGFLAPSLSQSTSSGTDINVPWYWNIAPPLDATFNLRHMSRRGPQISAELRHLDKKGQGKLKLEYLNDSLTNTDRYLSTYIYSGKLAPQWTVKADLNEVSDAQYFTDLGQNLNLTSITHLPRYLSIRHDNSLGYLTLRAKEYQAVNSVNLYQRLPQLSMDLKTASHQGIRYSLKGDLSRFEHKDNLVTGDRLDLTAGMEYNWQRPGGYFRPGVKLRHTRYQLKNTTSSDTPVRSLSIASLDSGLFFERPLTLFRTNHRMTLEPRLYYLYSPYKNQDLLPVFDTTLPDLRYEQLFQDNRFSGPDRQSDANQLTLALSSRLIRMNSGEETLRASIGQTFYFDDRKVLLPGPGVDTSGNSSIVGELEASFRHTKIRISGLWDNDKNQPDKAIMQLHYSRDQRHQLSTSYRYQRNLFEQADISTRWKLDSRWNTIARWTWSLRNHQTVESLAGLEYSTCCWSVQFAGRRYLTNNGANIDSAFFIQLNLKGLGDIGQNINNLLDVGLLGYQERSTVQ